MEKQWVQNHKESYIATHINGTGPFELDQYKQGVRLVYKRNKNYYKDPAAITKLTFNSAKEESVRVNKLVTGETDVTVNVSPQDISRVKNAKKATIDAVPSTRTIFSAMRYDVKPFSAPKFREALNYAIDLQSIVKNVLSTFGDETSQPGLQGFTGYDPGKNPYPHDPGKAESLVKQSGHAGASITLNVPTGRYLKGVEIAQAVANQIDSLSNVSCAVKQRDFSTLAGEVTDGKIKTSPHFYLLGWGNATFDSAKTITPLLTTNGPVSSYSNNKLDALIQSAGSQGDAKKRDATLQNANDLCHNQAPWIFLNRQYSVYGASKRIKWTPRRDERIDAYSIERA